MRILLINNYDSYADLLAYTLGCVAGVRPTVLYNDATSADAILAQAFDRIVLSPGPGHPSVPRDFGVCAEVIARSHGPLLGVCLGHQGIAMVHGGQLVLAPEAKHGKRSRITHNGHPLFHGVPSPFTAMRYHSWVVDAAQLPDHVEVLARAQDDGAVMALGLRERPVVGVQFHPESIGTPWGRRLLENFLRQGGRRAPPRARAPVARTARTALSAGPRKTRRPAANKRRIRLLELPWREPEMLFAHHYVHRPYAFWLDTAAPSDTQRWSFMGAPHRVLQTPQGATAGEPWAAWRQALAKPPEGLDTLPCPFAGGLVGHLTYAMQRFGHDATGLAAAGSDDDAAPESVMQVCRRFLAFDHVGQRVYAVAVQRDASSATQWLHSVQARWRAAWPAWTPIKVTGHCPSGAFWPPQVRARINQAGYMRRIAEAQERIRRGDIYEVCLSNRFYAPGHVDPWHLYRILRHTHPAPYAAFLKGPTSSVLSASPERFLTLDPAGHITTEPIKGTRAHIGTPGALAFQRRQLRHSPKDQAELLMVVDLLRNDLARVAQSNSVRVPDLFHLSNHPTVVQMSAIITAKLRTRCDAVDLLRACFPGGSITGAPKRRAMDIIDALEGHPRGVYTGSIGYLSTSGAMNLNIAIRTIAHDADGVSFGAGGAITADSDPWGECEEVEGKAFAMARAIALAQDGSCGAMRVRNAQGQNVLLPAVGGVMPASY